MVTDLYEESLVVTRENVLSHLEDPGSIELSFHAGDLLSRVPGERPFSLVYENLRNLPSSTGLELRSGTIGGRFNSPTKVAVSEPFAAYLLSLHYRFLTGTRTRVSHGGGVLTAIGGRIPNDVAFKLHRECGYEPELVAFDLKLQVEPGLMIPRCARAEAERDRVQVLRSRGIGVVAALRNAGLEGQPLADAAVPQLELIFSFGPPRCLWPKIISTECATGRDRPMRAAASRALAWPGAPAGIF